MTLVLIAIGVAMDCTAVSAAYALKKITRGDLLKLAITFGGFQAGTALLGALGGEAISRRFGGWDSWIAFFILLVVGGHMIYEAFHPSSEIRDNPPPVLAIPLLLALGVATSIDSLAVGATLPTLGLPILLSASAIGITSFLFSFVGAWLGKRIGEKVGPAVEILGGLVLIAIGVKTLFFDTTL